MSCILKNSLVLVLSLIMVLLPLRYAYSGAMDTASGDHADMAASMPGCSSLVMKAGEQDNPVCPGHDLDGKDLNDCCWDHCGSSAQLLGSMELSLHISSSYLHFQDFSLKYSDIFLSPGHRPPLNIS